MDFQLKLTFTGKNHKDMDFQSTKSLDTLRHIKTLTIRVQTATRQLKMEENSVNTLFKFAVFKNGGKLEKTGYTGSIRSPKRYGNCCTCPRAQRVLQLLLENYHTYLSLKAQRAGVQQA